MAKTTTTRGATTGSERRGRSESIYVNPAELRLAASRMAGGVHRAARCVFAGREYPAPIGRRKPEGLPEVLERTKTTGAKTNVAVDCPALRRASLAVVSYDGEWQDFGSSQLGVKEARQALVDRGLRGVTNGPKPSLVHSPRTGDVNVGVARLYVPVFTAEALVTVSGRPYHHVVCLAHEHLAVTNLPALRTRLDLLGVAVDNGAIPSGPDANRIVADAFRARNDDVAAPVATTLVLEQRFMPVEDAA